MSYLFILLSQYITRDVVVTKYLLKRLLHGLISVVIVVAIVMILVYSLMSREVIFARDGTFTKRSNNDREIYKYTQWEKFGYLDYVPYSEYLQQLTKNGEIDEETRAAAVSIAKEADNDPEIVKEYVEKFTEYYEGKGYTVVRLDPVMLTKTKLDVGGRQQLFAYKDYPLLRRLWTYFTGILKVDDVNYVEDDIEDRGLTFTLHDPIYGGDKFSPAIIGNGTKHKYLLYFDSTFPYLHQNLLTVNLGLSYSVNNGVDVFDTMTQSQGAYVTSTITYPTGLTEEAAYDLHTATYASGSRESSPMFSDRFTDDYTNVSLHRANMSKTGYSFVIGIISVVMAYLLSMPLGILMARNKDKLVDKIGTLYIVFILAVPSLAYIFLFKALGGLAGLPTTFMMEGETWLMYILPIISLALPSIANLMKWLRRYMIDQMNSDYVKFARSGGLSEGEIFSKHILKNAAIPIVHGIPASVLGALVGAIITERVYLVPGAGNLLTTAINNYDNGVIVGLTLFYAMLSIISIILGDILMAMVDPRISFSTKAR